MSKILSKIKDSDLVYSTRIEWGNENDWTNALNRVAPGISTDDANELYSRINKQVKDGDKLLVSLSKDPVENSLIDYRIGNMNLTITQINN